MNAYITIKGKEYPCQQTMGALLRFKEQTGKDISQASDGLNDMIVLLYCCVVSASKREGVDFDMSLLDFADNITTEDLMAWTKKITTNKDDDDGEKKTL